MYIWGIVVENKPIGLYIGDEILPSYITYIGIISKTNDIGIPSFNNQDDSMESRAGCVFFLWLTSKWITKIFGEKITMRNQKREFLVSL